MIQIFADGAWVYDNGLKDYCFKDNVLIYDSRLEEYDLQGLRITTSLNKGGVAEIVMPPQHPSYGALVGYRTIVRVYRDGDLRFRGRALYPTDDYNNIRTVVCEGELCFLQDGISRPHLYQDTPQAIFEDVVAKFNAQVEDFKRFKLGAVTVTDPNNYIRLESEEAETVLATINKLVDRCGGYIVFTTDDTGARVINWLDTVGGANLQTIEAGENLFDFSSTGANTDLATALIPYGAKNETTGERITIESVNDGLDYIVDEAAVALRGTIFKTATWDDVTEPLNLLNKARQYLNENKLFVTSLTLSALDLSYIDKTVESFKLGDRIRVISGAHGVDEDFQLTEITEDVLNPGRSLITMGKEHRTLTGLDVAGDNKGQSDLQKATSAIKKDFELNVQVSVEKALESEETAEKITSIIEQQAGNISLSVSGSLGSKAAITLTTTKGAQTSELDLSAVRQAFATDTSAVEISGGTITFNSGTLIVNSTNLQVSADGTIHATNAVLSGTATTENGLYKSELSGGRLRFYYEGTEYGGIASDYIQGRPSARGVTVRLTEDASYMGFSRLNPEGDGYTMWYCINFGANINNRTERHLFFDTAYFSNTLTTAGAFIFDGAYNIRYKTSGGSYINGLGLSNNNQLVVGESSINLFVYGANVYIGQNDAGLVQIQGASMNVTSPCAFYDTATFNGAASFVNNATFNAATTFQQLATYNASVKYNANAFFASGKGVAFTTSTGGSIFALNMTNDLLYVGHQDAPVYVYGKTTQLGMSAYPTTITGSSVTVATSIYVQGTATFDNGYGVLVKDTSGTANYVLSMTNSNNVNVGATSYKLYLRGTSVTVGTGHLNISAGSLITANGYGVVGTDNAGSTHYILSLTSGNQVNVGVANYVTYLRGTAVYLAGSGAAVTSDERKKNSIEELPEAYEAMLDKLTPVRYKYNDGTSGRYHAGFRAQEVKEALEAAGLTTQDFGGFVDLNGDGEELGLIYSEFIAILLQKIKRQEQRIAALEEARI